MENNTAIGIETWGSGNSKTRGKQSKLDIITNISVCTKTKDLDIFRLNLIDLNKILRVAKSHKTLHMSMPLGRLKKPYLEPLVQLFPTVKNLDKLPVSSLKSLLGAFLDE